MVVWGRQWPLIVGVSVGELLRVIWLHAFERFVGGFAWRLRCVCGRGRGRWGTLGSRGVGRGEGGVTHGWLMWVENAVDGLVAVSGTEWRCG